MAGWFEAVLPVASAFLGAAAAFGGVWLAQSRQDRREAATRGHERKVAVVARREEFELQHLMEVHRLLEANHQAFLLWEVFSWQLGDEVTDRAFVEQFAEASHEAAVAHDALWSQVGFILSDDVRGRVHHVAGELSWFAQLDPRQMGGTRDLEAQGERSERVRDAHEAIAARVREIYASREAG